jgi:hypothetical protein
MSLASICKLRRYDGPTPCRFPECDCTVEADLAARYNRVPWLFRIFNTFTLWIVFLLLILYMGRYH